MYPTSSDHVAPLDTPAATFLGDMMFYAPLNSLALSLSNSTSKPSIRKFHFNAELPNMSGEIGLGNHHGVEIPFVFGTRTFWDQGSKEEKSSEEMMRRWSSLASGEGGNGLGPKWEEWTVDNPMKLIIGPGGGETVVVKEVFNEVEEKRNDFWMKKLRGGTAKM